MKIVSTVAAMALTASISFAGDYFKCVPTKVIEGDIEVKLPDETIKKSGFSFIKKDRTIVDATGDVYEYSFSTGGVDFYLPKDEKEKAFLGLPENYENNSFINVGIFTKGSDRFVKAICKRESTIEH